jgi:hypothetical protein
MKHRILRSTVTAAAAVALMSLAGCDRSPVEPPGHRSLGTVALYDLVNASHVAAATWTHTGGWQGTLAPVSHAAEADRTRAVFGVRMWTQGGEEIQLSESGEYSARYRVDSDPANVVNMTSAFDRYHGDHVYVFGYHQEGRTGTAQLIFQLFHDGHSDGDTDAIAITFVD